MSFTPLPGTGNLEINPQFVNINLDNYSILNSQLLQAGEFGLDIGAYQITPRPKALVFSELNSNTYNISFKFAINYHLSNNSQISDLDSIVIYRNHYKLQTIKNISSDSIEIIDQVNFKDNFSYKFIPYKNGLAGSIFQTGSILLGTTYKGIVIWNLANNTLSSYCLKHILEELNYDRGIYISRNIETYELNNYIEALFIFLGMYPNNIYFYETFAAKAKQYLLLGGNIYLEGGDTWYEHPLSEIHSYFDILCTNNGSSDLIAIQGIDGTFTQNMSCLYSGANSSIDILLPQNNSVPILKNQFTNNFIAIANVYKDTNGLIGASFEFGGMEDNNFFNKKDYISKVLQFFRTHDLTTIACDNVINKKISIYNYPNPFNPTTTFSFVLDEKCEVKLNIYDISGKLIRNLCDKIVEKGKNSIVWDGKDNFGNICNSGVYLYKIEANKSIATGKMILIK